VLQCSEEVLFLFSRTGLVCDLQVCGGFRICEAHEEVLCLLDHCTVMLVWEDLLPEVLVFGAGKKRTPGKSLKSKS